jgi:4-hydroxy-tetrahydrodipicolinate reductase
VFADADIWCESLGRSIPAGNVVGVVDGATFETREGPSFSFEMAGRLYGASEADYNEWVIKGEPAELRLWTVFRRRSPRAHRSSTGSRM